MNIDINAEKFASEFAQAASFASAKSPKESLQNIHVVVNDEGLFLNATDMFQSICIKSAALVERHANGQVLIPIDRGGRMLRELKGDANLVVGDKSAKIKGDGCTFSFPTANPDEFPTIKVNAPRSHVTLPASVFVRMVKETAFVCDDDSSRYALGGVSMEHDGKKLTMVATDGRRMSAADFHCDGQGDSLSNGTTIVPKKSLQTVARLFAKSEGVVRLSAPMNNIEITGDSVHISIRLIEGRFPNWRQIEDNKKSGIKTTISVEELHRSVRRAAVVTDFDSRGIDLEFSSDGLAVMGRGESSGESSASTDLLWNTETVVLTLDNSFISEFCRSVDADSEITLEVTDAKSPVFMTTGNGYLHMIQCMVRDK